MIADHKGEIPVVILLLPFLAGIGLGLSFFGSVILISCILAVLCITFALLNFGYGKLNLYKIKWLGGLLLHSILFLAGWLITIQRNELNNPTHFSKVKAQYLVAHINSEPKVKNDLTRFTVAIIQAITNGKIRQTSGTLLVTIKDEVAKNLFYGEELLIPANYAMVDPPFNPGEFNYKQYLAYKNVYHQSFLYPKQYAVVKAGYGNPVIAYALELRQNLVKKLKQNMRDTTAIAVASTLILGYKADLSNDVLQAYSKTGTIHILSVSGGHVAIIYLILGWMLAFLNRYKHGRIIKAVIIIVLIWGYALLTGFSPAVCRAAVMISMVITGKTYSRYINSLNILAVSAFALLLYDPFLLVDVGFQLSYLAVAGLVVFQPIVYNWMEVKNWLGDKIWQACSVSTSAQVITFPLSAFYFHQFPVYFLLSNLLITIPIFIIMYAGLALLILPQINGLSPALGYILENTILLMNKCLAYIEHTPYASIGKIWLSRTQHLLLYVIIIALFYWLYNIKRTWLLKTALATTLLFCISISFKRFRSDQKQSVIFLNLRKHTGIVFKNGSRGVVISDLADTDKNFQYSIQPCLDSNRIADYIICKPGAAVQLPWLMKQGGLMQFSDKKLLLLNHQQAFQSIPQQLKIDYLYISGNPFVNTKAITNQTVILDGSNSDRYIDKLKNIPVNCIVLKRNKSVTIVSK
jgi:competence protein ComEC